MTENGSVETIRDTSQLLACLAHNTNTGMSLDRCMLAMDVNPPLILREAVGCYGGVTSTYSKKHSIVEYSIADIAVRKGLVDKCPDTPGRYIISEKGVRHARRPHINSAE